jgi:hypothetical protein
MPFASKKREREYNRQRYLKDRDTRLARQIELDLIKRTRRRDLLSIFPCVCCNEPDTTVIQWHHVDSTIKEFDISKSGVSEERWWDEVLKCIPVCANCHVKIHKNKLCLLPQKL